MNPTPSALDILKEERAKVASSVPADLVEAVYLIEERVQFDMERPEAATKIRKAVEAQLAKETLEGDGDGNEA